MQCPKCCSSAIRAPITNNMLEDQVVRRRQCADCGHKWFTVEVTVPDYAVGWSAAMLRKPVLRAPVTVTAKHQEAKDRLALLREARERQSAAADLRHRVTDCD